MIIELVIITTKKVFMNPSDTSPAVQAPTRTYISNPFKLLAPTYQAFKVNAGTYFRGLVIVLGGSIVAVAIIAAIAWVNFLIAGSNVGAIVALLLGGAGIGLLLYASIRYVNPAVTRLYLAMARGEKIGMSELMKFDSSLGWKLFVAEILAAAAIIGGTILFIIPGIIFATWFSFVSYAVVDEGLSGTDALKRSRELVRGRFWEVMGSSAVLQVLAIVQIIPIIGFILSTIASIILAPLLAVRYVSLVELKAAGDEAVKNTPISGWNYAAIVLAIVSFGVSVASSSNNSTSKPAAVNVSAMSRSKTF